MDRFENCKTKKNDLTDQESERENKQNDEKKTATTTTQLIHKSDDLIEAEFVHVVAFLVWNKLRKKAHNSIEKCKKREKSTSTNTRTHTYGQSHNGLNTCTIRSPRKKQMKWTKRKRLTMWGRKRDRPVSNNHWKVTTTSASNQRIDTIRVRLYAVHRVFIDREWENQAERTRKKHRKPDQSNTMTLNSIESR